MRRGISGAVFLAILFAVIVFIGSAISQTIPAGYVGIVYNLNGGIEDKVLSQGWHVEFPTKKIIQYTVAREQSYMTKDKKGDSSDDESFEIPTKEGASLDVDLAFGYSFDRDRIPETFTRFKGQNGKEILETFIKPNMQSWVKEITPEFGMIEIVSKERGKVNSLITERMQELFYPYGIIIDKVSLTDVRPDKDTDKAIKAKIKAQEEKEKAKITAETEKINAEKEKAVAEINAEKGRAVAEINAEKVKIDAEAEATARKIRADAEAEANKKIAASLTKEFNEYQTIKKWNGAEPQIIGGDAAPIIDMRKVNE